MQNIEFERLTYPRISNIVDRQNESELRSVSLEVLANACIRGTKIHSYCTSHLLGLWGTEVEVEYQPYVNSFIEWANENIYQTLYNNIRLYDDEKKFSGEFDLICVMKKTGRSALLDLKCTAKESKTWIVKMAAYKHLCEINGFDVEDVCNIHLKKTQCAKYETIGEEKVLVSPPVVKVKDIQRSEKDIKEGWDIFTSALKCYDYFERKKKKEEAHVSAA